MAERGRTLSRNSFFSATSSDNDDDEGGGDGDGDGAHDLSDREGAAAHGSSSYYGLPSSSLWPRSYRC